jgi:hypothetical protein
VLLPIAAIFAAYAMLHIEGRFIAPYVVVLWLVLFRSLAIARSQESRTALTAVVACAALITGFTLLSESVRAAVHMARFAGHGQERTAFLQSGYSNWKVASYLRAAGVRPGDRVGSVAWSFSAYWARMARVRIVAEVPSEYDDASAEWFSAAAKRPPVMQRFRDLGVKAIVAKNLPAGSAPASWQHIDGTPYHVYVFDQTRTANVE